MKRYLRPKLVLRLAAIVMIAAVVVVPLTINSTRSHAASEQAKEIAIKSFTALTQVTGSSPQLVRVGNSLIIKKQHENNGVALTAKAEVDLRRELASQGYTKAKIDAAIAVIKSVAKSIAQQAANDSISIPTDAHGTIGLGANVTLSLPSDNSTGSAVSLTQNAVLYSNTNTSTDAVVKAIDAQTVETYHIIRSKNAPEQFVYKLNNLPAGMLLRQVDAQTVEVYFPQQIYRHGAQMYTLPKTIAATIKAPWAHDANGVSVPISLTIGAKNTVILHVLHKNGNYLYPIVADPFAHWGWWGFMWWGDDWTINHFMYALGGLTGVFALIAALGGPVGWAVAAAVAGAVTGLAGWCEGRNGATYYFLWSGAFSWCQGW